MIELLNVALLSGLGAGFVAVLATLAIERLGGHLGGIIGTLPTTIIPASWGLWYQVLDQSESSIKMSEHAFNQFSMAMYAVPTGMCLNALFLWMWKIIPQRSHWVSEWSKDGDQGILKAVCLMSTITLSLWSCFAFIWVMFSQKVLDSSQKQLISGILALLLIIIIGLWATRQYSHAPKGSKSVGWSTLFCRGLCAAIAVGIAVLISKSGASTLAGVAAVFPAIFWTTMVSLWVSQGQAVPSGAVGPMMLGSSSVAVFALSAPGLYDDVGPFFGAMIAWGLAAGLASVPSYLWVRRSVTN